MVTGNGNGLNHGVDRHLDVIELDARNNEFLFVGKAGGPRLVALIPAFNEERFIGSVVLQARRYAQAVVVVDDGSTDCTADVAAAAGAIVVRHRHNCGKGGALNTGFSKVRQLQPDVVVTLDGDGQHLPEEMAAVAAPVLAGEADIVVGSRYLEPKSQVPRARIFGHRVFNFLTNRASGMASSDSQSGFRAFSAPVLDALVFRSRGFSVESEMQFIAKERNLKIVEVPIRIQYQDKPKRPVVTHGLLVLNGVLRFIGQYRPLLFFGVLGLLALMIGIGWGVEVVNSYSRLKTLAVGYALLSVLFALAGIIGLFCGIMLHSIRGLLLELVGPRPSDVETLE